MLNQEHVSPGAKSALSREVHTSKPKPHIKVFFLYKYVSFEQLKTYMASTQNYFQIWPLEVGANEDGAELIQFDAIQKVT